MERKSNKKGIKTPEEQMRAKFLRTLTSLIGKRCVVITRNNPTVEGIFKGYYAPGDAIIISNLKPPFHILPEMIIRMSDVVHFTLENVIVQAKGHGK